MTQQTSLFLFTTENLFSTHYLSDRLPLSELWADETEAANALLHLRNVYAQVKNALPNGNEEDVEDRLVAPVLTALGFGYEKRRVLTSATGAKGFPDFLLYAAPELAQNAFDKHDYWAECLGLLEAKRWGIVLQTPATRKERSPHLQLRDYLNERTDIPYGIVTNGGEWRLYAQNAPASAFLAVELAQILRAQEGDKDAEFAFRLFYTLFGCRAFVDKGRLLHEARAGAERFREEIEAQLRLQVFDAMETLAAGFLAHHENNLTEKDLPELFNHCLILLYRILFALNAEARNLLPTDPAHPYYASHGIEFVRKKLADKTLAAEYEDDGTFSLWGRLEGLFSLINGDRGDRNERYGVPRYNGGLFDPARTPFLRRCKVGDNHLSRALETLTFRKEENGGVTAFDYAGLGERHLGSIYEGLLEHTLLIVPTGEALTPQPPLQSQTDAHSRHFPASRSGSLGRGGDHAKTESSPLPSEERTAGRGTRGEGNPTVTLRNDRGERKAQGAYYTPQDWVAYLTAAALTPLLERIEKDPKVREKEPDSFAEAVLTLNVCDPAMGSGHFLVEATALLADAIAAHPTTATGDPAYWRRRVVEACIYGVDRNPLAVELAKLSLWLKTVDRVPLNFLDHHLLCGNSLLGTDLAHLPNLPAVKRDPKIAPENVTKPAKSTKGKKKNLAQLSMTFTAELGHALREAIAGIHQIEGSATDTHEIAKEKERVWKHLSQTIIPRFTCAADLWMTPYFGGTLDQDAFDRLIETAHDTNTAWNTYEQTLRELNPFHWELAFPDVFFTENGDKKTDPGFDAVIGNPPWERIKLAENEFFAARSPEIAGATRASDRKKLIADLIHTDADLAADFERAKRDAERTLAFVHNSGFYPRMGAGDTNLYAVFTEKATQIAARRGRVALLVPSGVATDMTTAGFFRHIVENGRLSELLDFENRGGAFPDVHRSFKFSIFVLAGEGDPQTAAHCGFFLHSIEDALDESRTFPLTPADFATFNPNTLTCPVFRRKRDAELTRKLYFASPILIKKPRPERGIVVTEDGEIASGLAESLAGVGNAPDFVEKNFVGVEKNAEGLAESSVVPAALAAGAGAANPWGVRFLRMFDMTNDSGKFKTAKELDDAGFWLGDGNVFTKGATRYLPLYEGKMVQMYDHRAASIKINPANLHRAAQEAPVSFAEHADPAFSPMPQYWVDEEEILLCTSFVPPILVNAYRAKSVNGLRQAFCLWLAGWKSLEGDAEAAMRFIVTGFPQASAFTQFMRLTEAQSVAETYAWSQTNQDAMKSLLPAFLVNPETFEKEQWIEMAKAVIAANKPAYLLGYKDVTAPTNVRSVIPAIIPFAGVGNTFCLVNAAPEYPLYCLLANLSSYALDYVARQKIGGQHLNFFIVEQFPVLPPERYSEVRDGVLLSEFVRARVLELVYTAHDMTAFARSLGYAGELAGLSHGTRSVVCTCVVSSTRSIFCSTA